MPNNWPEDELPPEIRAVFQNYPQSRPSRGFDARFWSELEARQHRYRGFTGFLRRVWELEIEGVLVWRLALSTVSGGASCALILGLATGIGAPQTTPLLPNPLPESPLSNPNLRAFAWYRRDWEAEFLSPAIRPTALPRALKNGSDFSWNGSNAHLA